MEASATTQTLGEERNGPQGPAAERPAAGAEAAKRPVRVDDPAKPRKRVKKEEIVTVEMQHPVHEGLHAQIVVPGVSKSSTIRAIKDFIESEYGVPVSHQTLIGPKPSLSRVFSNEESLEGCGIDLGFRTDKITGHGHVIVLRTLMPIREYYPGGEIWSVDAAPDSTSRGERMKILLLAMAGILATFSTLLLFLTSD